MSAVAVVLRTKDRAILLERALESVASQTFRDFELVVVNDAGDRDSVDALVDAVRDRLPAVTVVHNDESGGREAAMNTGILASDAPAFAIHDDDDTWHPTFLERTTAALAEAEHDIVVTRCEVVYEEIRDGEVVELSREILSADVHSITLLETLFRNSAATIAMLIRRSAYERVGPFDGELPVLADWEFVLRVLRTGSVAFVDGEPLAMWHRRVEQRGALGNSVHAAGDDHRDYNVLIRDRYLRTALDGGDRLGEMLLLAEGFRRLDAKADSARAENARVVHEGFRSGREHLELVDLHLAQDIERLRQESLARDERIDVALARLQHLIDLQEAADARVEQGPVNRFRRAVRRGRARLGRSPRDTNDRPEADGGTFPNA